MEGISKRAAAAIALPLTGCLLLALLLGLQWWNDLQRVRSVDRSAEVMVRISAVVSALQNERAATAAVLAGIPEFRPVLAKLRTATDERQDNLASYMAAAEPGHLEDSQLPEIQIAMMSLEKRLPVIRMRTNNGELTSFAGIGAYTLLMDRFTDAMDAFVTRLSIPPLLPMLARYDRLHIIIEHVARERSLGTALLGTPGADRTYYRLLMNNIAAQEVMLDELSSSAPGTPAHQVYAVVSRNAYYRDLAAFREGFQDTDQLAAPSPDAAMAWFRLSSAYIRYLETTLKDWMRDLRGTAHQSAQQAVIRFSLLGFGVLLLLAVLTWMSWMLARRLVWQMKAERRDAERIRYFGRHDPLTGLPNRYFFQELLERSRQNTLEHGDLLALFILDLVDFSAVNRTWGIAAGDEVLRAMVRRITRYLPPDAVLGRLQGDEFGIVQPRITDKTEAETLALALVSGFAEPIQIGERSIPVHLRMGITLYPPNAKTYETLLRNADLARRHVSQGSGYTFYVSGMYQLYQARKALEREIDHAVDDGQFTLLYQPKIDLQTNRLCGLEALIRWDHPRRGVLHPSEFIQQAERSGAIVAIGAWTIAMACRQLLCWERARLNLPVLSVNLSPVQLRQADMVDRIKETLNAYGINPACLELEVTETALIEDFDKTREALCELRRLGVGLAIDDFGTGYSSLIYLQRLPATRLKLDREFVSVLETSVQSKRIVEAVITLSHGLGMRVVAEGVENESQLQMLRDRHCDEAQGYLFAPPLSPDALLPWLTEAVF